MGSLKGERIKMGKVLHPLVFCSRTLNRVKILELIKDTI